MAVAGMVHISRKILFARQLSLMDIPKRNMKSLVIWVCFCNETHYCLQTHPQIFGILASSRCSYFPVNNNCTMRNIYMSMNHEHEYIIHKGITHKWTKGTTYWNSVDSREARSAHFALF